MLIDTHCHINMIVKKEFDVSLTINEINSASKIIDDAKQDDVTKIINVGTSLVESKNCIELSKKFENVYAAIGIHPNDLTTDWKEDLKAIQGLTKQKESNKIVAIGECGIDLYRPGYNLQKQKDAFKFQIELALENELALIVHSRSAPEETLYALDEFHKEIKNCVIHCFSEGQDFADQVIKWNFFVGIGGTITYPKNDILRDVLKKINLTNVVLETDAPFLPPQIIRGKQNQPKYIKAIATFIAELLRVEFPEVANITTGNALKLFKLNADKNI